MKTVFISICRASERSVILNRWLPKPVHACLTATLGPHGKIFNWRGAEFKATASSLEQSLAPTHL